MQQMLKLVQEFTVKPMEDLRDLCLCDQVTVSAGYLTSEVLQDSVPVVCVLQVAD